MNKRTRLMPWLFAAALVLVVAGWYARPEWRGIAPPPALPAVSEGAPDVLIGQAYAGRLVILQAAQERAGGAAPARLTLLPLHAPGQAALTGGLDAAGPQPLGPVYPPAYGGRPVPAGCAGAIGAKPAAPASSVGVGAYVPNKGFEDYFSPGMPDHCEADTGLLRYEATAAVPASLPVLAVAGWPPLRADTATLGQPRPLSATEQADVQTYRGRWLAAFRQAFGKDYDAQQSPTGDIPTLADAVQVAVMKDVATGRARLRVSHWGMTSVAMHLSEVFIVDQLDDEGRVVRSWHFARPQGVLG